MFRRKFPSPVIVSCHKPLKPGENLTLLGGIVVNTGELSSAGGNITIAAVEGGNILRISKPGHLLSLEIDSSADISKLTSLAKSLTGQIAEQEATSIIVDDNGNVVLTGSNTIVTETPGTAIISGNIDVSTTSASLPGKVGIRAGSQVNVLGDRVALVDTNINADGINGRGTVVIRRDFGDNSIVPNSQQTSVNKNSFISADAIRNGNGGKVVIWSDGITNFEGNISAKGGEVSGNGGSAEVGGNNN